MPEQRSHDRFAVALPIQVWRAGMRAPLNAHFHDLSWGGASFTTETSIQVGEHLVVRFPWVSGQALTIEAEVLRSQGLDSGRWQIGLRFIHLSHTHEQQLTKLLKLLAGKRQNAAQKTKLPLAPVLEVILDDDAEFEDKLFQIAQGRLILTVVGTGYQPGQSLLLLVGQTHDATALPLRAHILRVIEIPPLDPFSAVGRPPLLDLELHLAHPRNELRSLTESFRSASRSRGSAI